MRSINNTTCTTNQTTHGSREPLLVTGCYPQPHLFTFGYKNILLLRNLYISIAHLTLPPPLLVTIRGGPPSLGWLCRQMPLSAYMPARESRNIYQEKRMADVAYLVTPGFGVSIPVSTFAFVRSIVAMTKAFSLTRRLVIIYSKNGFTLQAASPCCLDFGLQARPFRMTKAGRCNGLDQKDGKYIFL